MPRIRLLDQATVNKIAAGEVVERPASVVKEMVENAIDAGADKITVEIKDGGCALICITDNGCGIDADEVRTAFLRHSTSKIRRVEDLLENTTLGFRGEALASIAAVARVEMLTKTASAVTGIRFVIEGGVEKVCEEVACPNGTTVRVENLFFNTPARRKFLKKPAAEAATITDLMQKMALGHPEVSFRYLNGKREPSLYLAGGGNLKNSIYAVYGREVLDKMIPLEGEVPLSDTTSMTVRGYISRPQQTRANRTYENFFINGRYIRSTLLEKAIDEAYKDYIVPGTFPITVLHLEMDPSTLDVNVHPTKMEIRFMEEEKTRLGLFEVLDKALKEENLISRVGTFYKEPEDVILGQKTPMIPRSEEGPELSFEPFLPAQKPGSRWENAKTGYVSGTRERKDGLTFRGAEPPKGAHKTTDYSYEWPGGKTEKPKAAADMIVMEEPAKPETPFVPMDLKAAGQAAEPIAVPYGGDQIGVHEEKPADAPSAEVPTEAASTAEKPKAHHLRLVGQVFKTYWIAEEDDVFYLVDQHAAHERVLYDQYRAMLDRGDIDTQVLMEPSVVSVDPKAVAELDHYQPVLKKLGYQVEAFGEDAVIVRGVPFLFGKALPAEDMAKMLDMCHTGSIDSARDLLIDKIATMSCKAAVKGNDPMSFMEASSLLEQLFASANPYNCPHGRPTIISVTQYQLEKRFMRS